MRARTVTRLRRHRRLFAGDDAPNKVGCNDHARRKYVEALKLGDRRAARVVAFYGELYAVERDAKDVSAEERLRMRRARSMPLWDELAAEIARLDATAEPKSPLGKANTYFRRQNPALRAFLVRHPADLQRARRAAAARRRTVP